MLRPLPVAVLGLLLLIPGGWPVVSFAQPDRVLAHPSDGVETEASDPDLVNDLAWLAAWELEYELPEFEKFEAVLRPPDPDFDRAQKLCVDFLQSRRSHAVQVVLAAVVHEKGNSERALKLLKGVRREGRTSLDLPNVIGLWVRSQILFRLGRLQEARLDSDAVERIYDLGYGVEFDEVETGESDFGWSLDIPGDPDLLIPLVLAHAAVYFVLCLRCGRRQRREAGGSRRRLIAVSLAVTTLWTLPVLTAAMLISQDVGRQPGLIWWVLVELYAFFVVRSTMNPPNFTYVGKEPLPPCDDSEMLARIESLSQRMGVSAPVVRSQRALDTGRDSSAAFVGGLAPHSIVLYDTVLAQLKQDEQDAVIGHELGHIANRSIWVYVTIFPLTAVGIVALSFLGGSWFGIVAGLAIYVGVFRFLSRRYEYDCDRRAAIATSPDAMARGLRRIYAKHPLGKPGLLTSVVHSTASHPSLDERVSVLSELAASGATGPDQVVSVPFDAKRVDLCRTLVRFFAVAWLCLTFIGIAAGLSGPPGAAPLAVIHLPAFAPFLLVMAAFRRPARIATLRMKGRFHWSSLSIRQQLALLSLFGFCLLIAANIFFPDWYVPEMPRRSPIPGAIMGVLVIVLVGTMLVGGLSRGKTNKQAKLAVEITAAFQRNDFQEALGLFEDNRESLKNDRFLRYQEAVSFLAMRQYEPCLEICEQLLEEFPHFPLPVTALVTIYLDRGNPQRALDLTRAIEKDLHKLDAMPALFAARALRQLGQTEEALVECDRALKLAPDDTSVLGVMASLALDRDDRQEADRLIDFATSILPAEPLLIVARGERAILDGDQATLQHEHDALQGILEDDRLLNLHSCLARLAEALPDKKDSLPGHADSDEA